VVLPRGNPDLPDRGFVAGGVLLVLFALRARGRARCRVGEVVVDLGHAAARVVGIPFGPVFTIRALYRNLAGGDQATVADLLNQMGR
jgi:hypothetical protein